MNQTQKTSSADEKIAAVFDALIWLKIKWVQGQVRHSAVSKKRVDKFSLTASLAMPRFAISKDQQGRLILATLSHVSMKWFPKLMWRACHISPDFLKLSFTTCSLDIPTGEDSVRMPQFIVEVPVEPNFAMQLAKQGTISFTSFQKEGSGVICDLENASPAIPVVAKNLKKRRN